MLWSNVSMFMINFKNFNQKLQIFLQMIHWQAMKVDNSYRTSMKSSYSRVLLSKNSVTRPSPSFLSRSWAISRPRDSAMLFNVAMDACISSTDRPGASPSIQTKMVLEHNSTQNQLKDNVKNTHQYSLNLI